MLNNEGRNISYVRPCTVGGGHLLSILLVGFSLSLLVMTLIIINSIVFVGMILAIRETATQGLGSGFLNGLVCNGLTKSMPVVEILCRLVPQMDAGGQKSMESTLMTQSKVPASKQDVMAAPTVTPVATPTMMSSPTEPPIVSSAGDTTTVVPTTTMMNEPTESSMGSSDGGTNVTTPLNF